MKQVNFEQLAREFSGAADRITRSLHVGLDAVCAEIAEEAKSEIGTYQPAVGPFNEWDDLADSTKKQRVSAGFSEDEPLLRSGKMRASISYRVIGLAGVVGSTDQNSVYQEYGTLPPSLIPPRPFIGPAYVKKFDKLTEMIGFAVLKGFRVR